MREGRREADREGRREEGKEGRRDDRTIPLRFHRCAIIWRHAAHRNYQIYSTGRALVFPSAHTAAARAPPVGERRTVRSPASRLRATSDRLPTRIGLPHARPV